MEGLLKKENNKLINNKKVKKISTDFFYNFLASVVITGTAQLIVYPLLASWLSSVEYGTIVSVIGVSSIFSGGFGTALNNARLISLTDYSRNGVKGDFNIYLLYLVLICGISIFSIGFFFFKFSITISLILTLTTIIALVKNYLVVQYRIILNFKKMLLCNSFGALGYIVGIFLFRMGVKTWLIVFLSSEIASFSYAIFSTRLLQEPFKKTSLFSSTLKKTMVLISSLLLTNMITYFDRLFLYPTMGASFVSVYSVASFFGKSIAIVINPLSNVLLGYFSQEGACFDKKRFKLLAFVIFGISVVFIVICGFISPVFTSILYRDLYDSAKKYIFIANSAAIITVASNILQTVILKFSPIYYQLVKQGVYILIYLITSFILTKQFGLLGFCFAVLFSNITMFILVLLIGNHTLK